MAKVVAAQTYPDHLKDAGEVRSESLRMAEPPAYRVDGADARSVGPILASRIVSPTREAKRWMWQRRYL